MSSSKKRGVNFEDNMFDLGTAANEGFGQDMGVQIRSKPIIKSKSLDIYTIKPNPIQPRRVVPSAFRVGQPIEQLQAWIEYVESETERQLPINSIIFQNDETTETEGVANQEQEPNDLEVSPIEEPLIRLLYLASSIHNDGLTNPITVVADDDGFIIETGERRWMAYHLLYAITEDEKYKSIPARRMSELSLWRQATENNARDSLNAISHARQVAILLMDLHGWDNFQFMEHFEHEQDFYAQVVDADQWRIPYGKSEQLCSACGFENPSRIRQYRALLRLTHDQWTSADDNNTAERELRKWIKTESVTAVTDLHVDAELPALADKKNRTIFNRVWRKIQKGDTIKSDDIRQLEIWLQAVKGSDYVE
jgi:hypothetical protein